jgi:hypothetical protein
MEINMPSWKDELDWFQKRAYWKGFTLGTLLGAGLGLVVYLGQH